MSPANQRLDAAHRPVVEPEQRLVEHEQLGVVDCASQLSGEAVRPRRRPVQIGAVELQAIAAGALGPIHRDVGALEKVVGVSRRIAGDDRARLRVTVS
jgi:hypothetical protein